MTHVHYKFSSKLSYDTVVFDGPHITLTDLKRQIMGREKLRAGDCDLQITNAQTKQEYTDNEGLIPKGSSVIVRRIPISGGKSSSMEYFSYSTFNWANCCGCDAAIMPVLIEDLINVCILFFCLLPFADVKYCQQMKCAPF
uniref:DWNN domain-containing protein n=1 Tax=Seriola lalandi dorsalis TaxID=1841481 RepID=A0A3B4Y1H3_SERLL